jgi:hypothetical protein
VSRRTTHVVAAIMLAALLISAVTPAQAAPRRRVVVLLAPYMTWGDVVGGTMPNMAVLAKRSLLADMNVRAGAITGASTPDRGALVLSAGAPVNFADGAISAFSSSETVGVAKAPSLYQQYFGRVPGSAHVYYLGQPTQVLANTGTDLGNMIGALGAAVHDAGGKTAAIGSGDYGYVVDPPHASRPAGEAAADGLGLVDLGDVSNGMLLREPTAPYGTRANVPAILQTYRDALTGGASLVVVDPGDLSRSVGIASYTTTTAAAAVRAAAL